MYQGLASLYFSWYRMSPWADAFNSRLTYNSGTRSEHRCDRFTSYRKLLQRAGLCNMDRVCTLLDGRY